MKIKRFLSKKLFLVLILISTAIIGGFFYYLNKKENKNLVIDKKINIVQEPKKYEIPDKYTYVNKELGFSIDIPEEITGLYKCPSPIDFLASVKVFEDNENGMAYIAPEYYYEAKWDSELIKYVGPCEKINYSTEILRKETLADNFSFSDLNLRTYKPFLGWAIIVKTVDDENELGSIIKNMFGKGCSYTKTLTEKENIYQISFGDKNEKGLENTTCPTNFSYKFFYNSATKRILYIKLGQEGSFWGKNYTECYDQKMIDSLNIF